MNSSLWFSNLVFWSAQVALLVLVAGALPAVFQIRQPRVLLAYWRALLMLSLALPFAPALASPANHQLDSHHTDDPPQASSRPPVPSLHIGSLPNFQIIAQIVGLVILAGIAVRFTIACAWAS